MVVVGAYLRVFCTKRPAMVVVGGLLEGASSSKMGMATNRDKTQERNAIIHFLTIGVYTFSKITMSLRPPRWYRQPYWLMD
jgi:hypothetical protein